MLAVVFGQLSIKWKEKEKKETSTKPDTHTRMPTRMGIPKESPSPMLIPQ
jgi:hypothetical protein